MDIAAFLIELYGRIPPLVAEAAEGLEPDQLIWRPAAGANTIGWLAWHIGRVEDAQMADLTGGEQVWESG